ncbi:MAG TPA: prepilin-type N-terminal cleavage/methylation domain-containing protein [Methylophilaceae bacterium]|nr:prepilin-type N-terminal cleavage/methylation domain-containing protein [Methylophilaceae bacterium]
MQNIKNKQQGVLLIEVLFSILIFSFGILGLVGLQAVASQNSTNAEDRTIASTLANDIVSQMWLRKTQDTSGTASAAAFGADIVAWQTRVAGSGLSNATGTVTTAAGITTVTVTWRAPSKKAADSNNRYETQLAL